MQGGSGLSLDELVKFDWEVALGDQTLSAQDLMALARLKTPLVRVRGQWVLLDADEIKEAAARLKRRGEQATVRDLVRLALGGGDDRDIEGIAAEGWIDDLLARLTGREPIDDLPPPEGLDATLRPYQGRGYAWLAFLRRWGLGACLADDMGLGKTIQTLALIQHDRETAPDRAHRAAGLPDFGGRQLAAGGGALHAPSQGHDPPWRGADQDAPRSFAGNAAATTLSSPAMPCSSATRRR